MFVPDHKSKHTHEEQKCGKSCIHEFLPASRSQIAMELITDYKVMPHVNRELLIESMKEAKRMD